MKHKEATLILPTQLFEQHELLKKENPVFCWNLPAISALMLFTNKK